MLQKEYIAKSSGYERKKRWLLTGAVVGVMGVVTALGLNAQRQATTATLRESAARTQILLPIEPVEALTLAIQATGESKSSLFTSKEVLPQVQSSLRDASGDARERNILQGHQGEVSSVAFSPDGKTIVSGSADKTIRLWDTKGNPIAQPFTGHQGVVSSVAFSPDGKTIVSGSADKTIRLWDTKGNPIAQPFTGHNEAVNSVAFSPDGKTIASGSADGTIRLWDTRGNPIAQPFTGHQGGQSFIGHQGGVSSVAFSPDGKTIVSGGGDKTIRLWRGGNWLDWLNVSCNRLIGHPILVTPETLLGEDSEMFKVAKDARSTCSWNTLCRYGSLHGQAAAVKQACEKAVALAPKNAEFWDSRGITRALTGDKQGAIEDFQAFIKSTDSDERKKRRQGWIDALKAGKNPLTPEVIEELKR